VILVQGLKLHLQKEKVERATLASWQKPGSKLVQALSEHADVYAYAYSQNVSIDTVSQAPDLGNAIGRLRDAGYTELVLVGHSAGGVLARQFVEDHPDAGVTKVIQVCAPNDGCGYANLDWLCKAQRVFVDSLGKTVRRTCLRDRADRKIPDSVEFVCVVGDATGVGDIIVSDSAQWPRDLRDQGIPAVRWWTGHFWVTRNRADARKIAELVHTPHPRWDAAKVVMMKKKILGD
jgi:pimeloyl-ACP methyl ester carboxylesterase